MKRLRRLRRINTERWTDGKRKYDFATIGSTASFTGVTVPASGFIRLGDWRWIIIDDRLTRQKLVGSTWTTATDDEVI